MSGALSLCSICIGLRKNILKQLKLRGWSHNDRVKKITGFRELLIAVNKAIGSKGSLFFLTKIKERGLTRFQTEKEDIYVHPCSTAKLAHVFRDASQNPLCSASPGSENPKRSLRMRKVAGMVNRFVPYQTCSFL